MRKELDFITQYEQETKELMNTDFTKEEQQMLDNMDNHIDRVIELAELKISQYKKIPNQELRDIWENKFFPFLAYNAEIQGGKIIFDIDEKELTGILIYYGHDLIFDESLESKNSLSHMVALSREFDIASKNGMIELSFYFSLYTTNKIADHSKKIKEIADQIFHSEEIKKQVIEESNF